MEKTITVDAVKIKDAIVRELKSEIEKRRKEIEDTPSNAGQYTMYRIGAVQALESFLNTIDFIDTEWGEYGKRQE